MPKSIHKQIIGQEKALGYRGSREGMCYGIAAMVMLAILAGDLATFNKRISLLQSYKHRKKLVSDIEQVKRKVKKGKDLTDSDKELLGVLAFFEGMELHQNPKKYSRWFADYAPKVQSFIKTSRLHLPDLLQGKTIYSVCQLTHIYDEKKLKKLFDHLEDILSHLAFPVPIAITANDHAIVVHYDHAAKRWIFSNSNKLPSFSVRNTDKLAKNIMKGFARKGKTHPKLCMNLELVTTETIDKKTIKKLNALKKKEAKTITQADIRTSIPDVTFPSKLYGHRNGSLINFSASVGNVDVIKKILASKPTKITVSSAADYAVQGDQDKVIEMFYDYVLKDDQDEQLNLFLHACEVGSLKTIKFLLAKNPSLINTTQPGFGSPLHIAITTKNH